MATDNDDDILTPSDLGRKLVVALRSVTEPQALMQAISDRSSLTLRNELMAKLEVLATQLGGMQKATELWHSDLVRFPTDITKSVSALQGLMEQFIRAA